MSNYDDILSRYVGDQKSDLQKALATLPLTAQQIGNYFTPGELAQVNMLVDKVNKAKDENDKIAALLGQGQTVLKLLKSVGILKH